MTKAIQTEKNQTWITQGIPLVLTIVIGGFLIALIYGEVLLLNKITSTDILKNIRWSDVLVGFTIYLKTAVDFAIFIGNLMHQFPGWKNRIAIEFGTAAGNALGTIVILAIWTFFKDIDWLLAIMVFVASLVLFRLAEDGLEHVHDGKTKLPLWMKRFVELFAHGLTRVNNITRPFLSRIMPNVSMKAKSSKLNFFGLFAFSFSIPFILGLDDFAGYVPLFSIVNVFGFSIGVVLGHMILNLLLFISPTKTIRVVKNPVISFIGSIAFVGLGLWGLHEAAIILLHH